MKRISAILLVLVMILSLAACGEDGGVLGGGKKKTQADQKPTRGYIVGNTYTNGYADITFTKPEDWTYSSDDEIAQTMGIAATLIGTDMESILETTGSFYDMMVRDPVTGTNVSIMFENLAATGNRGISEDEYLKILQMQLEATGMGYEIGETSTATLSGTTYRCMQTNITLGVSMEQRYYVRIQGDYVVGVIVTLVDTDASQVLAMFS